MEDLWVQFHRLPKALRDAVASRPALEAISRIEAKYPSVDLATFVMRVMVKEFPVGTLTDVLQRELSLDAAEAADIATNLTAGVFSLAAEYLGIVKQPTTPPNLPIGATAAVPAVPIAASATEIPVRRDPTLTPAPLVSQRPAPAPRQTPPSAPTGVAPIRANVINMFQSTPAAGTVAPTTSFSREEAVEIEGHAARLRELGPNQAIDLDALGQRIIGDNGLAWPDDFIIKRALTLMKTRLKNLRSSDQTKELLVRPIEAGGLGLDPDVAGNVLRTLDDEVNRINRLTAIPASAPPASPPPPYAAAPQALEPEPIVGPMVTPMPPRPTVRIEPVSAAPSATPPPAPPLPPPPVPVQPTQPPVPAPIPNPEPIPAPQLTHVAPTPMEPIVVRQQPSAAALERAATQVAQSISPPRPVTLPQSVTLSNETAMYQRSRTLDRPTVSDITRPSTTVGPVEELAAMSVSEWRRLGQGANDSAKRLLDKFRRLQRESYGLFSQAVVGWRKSELYQLYLTMGRESLSEAVTISEVIQRRARERQPYLSEHEFAVLAEINHQLRT